MSKGLDTTSDLTAFAGALVQAGYVFAGRYYGSSWKALKPAEAAHLSAMGMYIVSVFEGASTESSYFTMGQGNKDAVEAVEQAQACGQPEGSPIYFAVDYDASTEDVNGPIKDYFSEVQRVVKANGFVGGVYGSGLVCRAMLDSGFVSFTWLAQSTGWAGYADFNGCGCWNIKQGPEVTINGLDCDSDESSSKGGGGWQVKTPTG